VCEVFFGHLSQAPQKRTSAKVTSSLFLTVVSFRDPVECQALKRPKRTISSSKKDLTNRALKFHNMLMCQELRYIAPREGMMTSGANVVS
jgi:hypothetical protein